MRAAKLCGWQCWSVCRSIVNTVNIIPALTHVSMQKFSSKYKVHMHSKITPLILQVMALIALFLF